MTRQLSDLEREYYDACDEAAAQRQRLNEARATVERLRRAINEALMRGELAPAEPPR